MKKNRIKVRVAGLVIKNSRLLLLNHHKDRESYWVLPGGGVEFGERARKGLEREFREELGIRVRAGELAFVDEVILPEGLRSRRSRHNIDMYFQCTAGSFKRVKLEKGTSVAGYGFFSSREMRKMDLRPPLTKELIRILNIEPGSVPFYSF
jgi:8-oxo-dGTP diphosphatase